MKYRLIYNPNTPQMGFLQILQPEISWEDFGPDSKNVFSRRDKISHQYKEVLYDILQNEEIVVAGFYKEFICITKYSEVSWECIWEKIVFILLMHFDESGVAQESQVPIFHSVEIPKSLENYQLHTHALWGQKGK